MRKYLSLSAIALATLGLPAIGHATTVLPVIYATNTYEVGNNIWAGDSWNGPGTFVGGEETGSDGTTEVQLGADYSDNNVEPIITFQLPTLPTGEQVSSSQVSISLKYPDSGVNFNANLVVLGVGNINTGGAFAPSDSLYQLAQAATVIAPAMFTLTSTNWTADTTTTTESQALAAILNSQYVAGEWLVLGLTPNSEPAGFNLTSR